MSDGAHGCLPQGWLAEGQGVPLAAIEEEEGARLPSQLPPVIDAHVHLFPERVFAALWRWFESHAWPIRYKLQTPEVISFLLSRGVERVVALHYAHKPGMARMLNAYMAEVCREEPRVLGVATVFPGEPGAADILREAFASGLRGVKLHCHVQCFSPDEPALEEVYRACVEADLPLVMHAGREPSSPHYKCNPYEVCSADRIERVLTAHPKLKLCVPHLGADEFQRYGELLERHENLWLDTTMAVSGFFPIAPPRRLLEVRPERILYGTDFPQLPYAWDREVKKLLAMKLPEAHLAGILGGNARALFSL